MTRCKLLGMGMRFGIIVLIMVTPALANSVTWIVNPDGSGDATTIQGGIDLASAGDIVEIACGTYVDLGHGPDGEIVMIAGITLRSETGQPDCVIVSGENQRPVMICDGDNATVIEGLTIANGYVSYQGFGPPGGLECSGEISVVRCVFTNNLAEVWGGVHTSDEATFTDCEFWGNEAEGCGGVSGPGHFVRCTFVGNYAFNSSGGGACQGLTFEDCYFEGNWGFDGGGGISGEPDLIKNSVFIGNTGLTLPGSATDGGKLIMGCLFINDDIAVGDAAIVNCTVYAANGEQAVHVRNTGICTIENTVIAAATFGEAVTCGGPSASVTVSCSNIYGNAGGDYVGCIAGQLGVSGNISENPLFCDAANGDLTVDASSPCLPPNNSCNVLIGARGLGCGDVSCPPGPRIVASDLNAWNGDLGTVAVILQESPLEVDAITMDIEYDNSVLSFVGGIPGGLTANWPAFLALENTPGVVQITATAFFEPPIPAGSTGNIAMLDFAVISCNFDGQTSALTPANLKDDFAGMEVCEGTFTCVECLRDGDVDNNDDLTAGDALCAFKIAACAGCIPPECDVPNWDCEVIASDLNCDDDLTAGDALEIFNRAAQNLPPVDCPLFGGLASASAEVKAFAVPLKDAVTSGNALTVPVMMEATRGQAAFGFEVYYDAEQVKFEGFMIGEAADHWMGLEANELEPGRVRVMGFDPEGLKGRHVSQGGMIEIAALRFEKLSDEAKLGSIEWIEQRLDREEPDAVPERVTKLDLSRPYPNPFRDAVSADVSVPTGQEQTVSVSVYDVKGRLVRTLLNETVTGGVRTLTWDRRTSTGQIVSSGIYFMRMVVGEKGFAQTRKLVVIR